jgi:hypothetical protein
MDSILHHDLVLDNISHEILDKDILMYLEHEFSEIRDSFEVIDPEWPGSSRLRCLVENAKGLFIYAATICRFIKSQGNYFDPNELLDMFTLELSDGSHNRSKDIPCESPFTRLDQMYSEILEHSLRGLNTLEDKVKISERMRILISTIAALSEPLGLKALGCLIEARSEIIHRQLKHLQSVLYLPDDQRAPVRLLHPSFRDFLFNNQRCTNKYFKVDKSMVHQLLARRCVHALSKHLREDMCKVQRSGISVSDVEKSTIRQAIPPEVEYACMYWIQHILNSEIEIHDDHWINEFLRRHILHWFEALSWIRRLSNGIHALSALELKIPVCLSLFRLYNLIDIRNKAVRDYSN